MESPAIAVPYGALEGGRLNAAGIKFMVRGQRGGLISNPDRQALFEQMCKRRPWGATEPDPAPGAASLWSLEEQPLALMLLSLPQAASDWGWGEARRHRMAEAMRAGLAPCFALIEARLIDAEAGSGKQSGGELPWRGV